ncbi:MAG: hypothetical protein AAF197_05860 [Pseudomonadota bacterium]
MNKIALGVFSIALSALLLELNLIRVFDVLWYPNMAYMVITLAVFSFGLAGVVLAIRPIKESTDVPLLLSILSGAMAFWVFHMKWAIDRVPFDYNMLATDQFAQATINFFLIYIIICGPFFLAGLVLSIVFTKYASQIRRLYFWDLIGAALGCALLIPLLPKIGTAGVLLVVTGLSLISAACFIATSKKLAAVILTIVAIVIAAVPFSRDSIDTFAEHMHKRGFKSLVVNINEGTWWDPISKINVLNTEVLGQKRKWIAYDGGTQSSYFYPFDGDYDALRAKLPQQANEHFWNGYVAVSHALKADSDADVLIIGAAGGQELKAALTYNAKTVDAIELVGIVVDLGKTRYAKYTGNIMNDPRANVQRGEGRSYLRQLNRTYDIIQIFSNHTSSSIAAGSGSMQSTYLQTVEAYKEYFTHLSDDGILHINHHIYPRMVATASKAWHELGRGDFRKHVLVAEVPNVRDDLPTLLVKMTPWQQEEVEQVKNYLGVSFDYPVDPFSSTSFLSDEFFDGDLSDEVIAKVPYRIEEPRDNKPFFNSLRKTLDTLPDYDADKFVNHGVSNLLNSQKSTGYPIDVMHLFISAGAAIFFAFVFTFGPLLFSNTGREKWQGKSAFMTYFACLGLGFIVFELVFIQIFMKVIGFPLYTYTTILFTFLFGAGVGSLASEKLQLKERGRYWVPFVGIVLSAILVMLAQQFLFDAILEQRTMVRILFSVALIFPLTFFLGMPFPLGVLAVEDKPTGTVAWAWALNGLFTVTGGVFCAIFSVYFGFIATMTVAILAYLLAYISIKALLRSEASV